MNNIQKLSYQSYMPFQPTLTAQGLFYFDLSVDVKFPVSALLDSILVFLQVKVDGPTPYPMVPDGTNALFFSPYGLLVGGTQLSILEMQFPQAGEYFGIWFKPGMLRQFFNVDLLDITQSVVGDDFLLSREFINLSERLYEKGSFSERVSLCESVLLKLSLQKPFTKLDCALHFIYQTLGSASVESLAEQVGLSRRQLNRLFSLNTGLSTKSFSQLVRVQTLLRRCEKNNVSTLHCGLDLGFYDQSHIAKSLKQHNLASLSLQTQQFMSAFYKPHQKESNILISK